MSKRWMTWSLLGALTTAGLGFVGARALATGAPQLSPLTYGGVLTDKDGKPYPSAQEVVLKFYDKVDATVPKCTAPATLAEAGTGRFSVVLPGECAQAVRDTPDLWSEATVGGGKTVLPRVHVGAVPYALEADSAKLAAGATGGLKAAVDGLVADVAALKKAPAGGGAPKVVDGAGVVLGTLIGADHLRFFVQTTKGFQVQIRPDGASLGLVNPAYESSNCSGPRYILQMGDNPWVPSLALASKAGWFTVINGNTVGLATPKTITWGSTEEQNGSCVKGSGNKVQAYAAQVVTPADLGVPEKITSPVVIVQ